MKLLRRRGKFYHVVIAIPIDLQSKIGRKQLWRSLQTERYKDARIHARKILHQADELFFQLRYGCMDKKIIDAMVAEFALNNLETYNEARLGIEDTEHTSYSFLTETAAGREMLSKTYSNLSDMYKNKLLDKKHHEIPFLTDTVDYFLKKYCISISKESDDYKQVLAAFAGAEKVLSKIEAERIVGDDDTDYQHRMISKWKSDLPEKKDTGIPFSELLKQFHEYQLHYGEWGKPYAKRKQNGFTIFGEAVVDLFGHDIGIRLIDEVKARDIVDYLKKLPTYTRPGEIQAKKLKNNEPVSKATVDKYVEDLSAAFNWGADVQRKYVDLNPFKKLGQNDPVKKRDKSREFTLDELQKYVDVLADTYDPDRPERTWIPLVMLFGGPRNNEVAQLFNEDIQEREGIWFFRIQKHAERGQHIKSDASARELPIHSRLIELGILKHKANMEKQGHNQLWPNLLPSRRDGRYYPDKLSDELNELIDKHITKDKKLRVYSLRSNFENAIEHKVTAGIVDAMDGNEVMKGMEGLLPFFDRALKDVMGHAQKGATTDRVYRKARLKIMHKIVEVADYEIDLSRLKEKL